MNKIGRIVCCAVLCVPMVAAIIVGITGRNGGSGDSVIPGSSGVSETAGLSKVKILSADGTLHICFADSLPPSDPSRSCRLRFQ